MMKTQHKPIVVVGGLAALAAIVYAGLQLMSPSAPAPASAHKDASARLAKAEPPEAQPVLPTLSNDPFQEITTAQVVTGPGTGMAGSASVVSPSAPMPGRIASAPDSNHLPSVQTAPPAPDTASEQVSPNGESVAPEPPTLALRGVMHAGELQAFVSIQGKRAKAFVVGEEVILGARITNIQPNFIELDVLGETIRLRVGQEVNFS